MNSLGSSKQHKDNCKSSSISNNTIAASVIFVLYFRLFLLLYSIILVLGSTLFLFAPGSTMFCLFVSFPQKRNGIVFSSGMNYLHSRGNIQSELSS